MSEITICKGATIRAEEVARVEAAMKKLVEDKGAAHELVVTVTLHNHNEYPKTLYKGKESRMVDSGDAEAAAAKDGFGPYDHEAFTAKGA
jgi:hypothetical protein